MDSSSPSPSPGTQLHAVSVLMAVVLGRMERNTCEWEAVETHGLCLWHGGHSACSLLLFQTTERIRQGWIETKNVVIIPLIGNIFFFEHTLHARHCVGSSTLMSSFSLQ